MAARNQKKVLLMGKSGSGKTSMRSIIFANYLGRDTMRLGATLEVEHSTLSFMDLTLNLWDCGGQDAFMENYLASQNEHFFSNVAVLIYVFDIESRDLKKDREFYIQTLTALRNHSPEAKIYVLIHKMDLIQENQRDEVFKGRETELKTISAPTRVTCFRTSIWDETLYAAWSDIVHSLIPNVQELGEHVKVFAQNCEADEVVLFERASFLVICHAQNREFNDAHRFEKISNIIKHFKLSCTKNQSNFASMEVGNSDFTAFIDEFTTDTYIMVIMSDKNIEPAATALNIQVARQHFDHLSNTLTRGY